MSRFSPPFPQYPTSTSRIAKKEIASFPCHLTKPSTPSSHSIFPAINNIYAFPPVYRADAALLDISGRCRCR